MIHICELNGHVDIPHGTTQLKTGEFRSCIALTSVSIPSSVTSIGNGSFDGCTALASVTIPDSVTSIGYGAFYNCIALTAVTIPPSVTSIGNSAFRRCTALTSITLPDSVTSVGNSAFIECASLTTCINLRSITLPKSPYMCVVKNCPRLRLILGDIDNLFKRNVRCEVASNTPENRLRAHQLVYWSPSDHHNSRPDTKSRVQALLTALERDGTLPLEMAIRVLNTMKA